MVKVIFHAPFDILEQVAFRLIQQAAAFLGPQDSTVTFQAKLLHLRNDLLFIIGAPMALVAKEVAALWGLFFPYDGRKLISSIERLGYRSLASGLSFDSIFDLKTLREKINRFENDSVLLDEEEKTRRLDAVWQELGLVFKSVPPGKYLVPFELQRLFIKSFYLRALHYQTSQINTSIVCFSMAISASLNWPEVLSDYSLEGVVALCNKASFQDWSQRKEEDVALLVDMLLYLVYSENLLISRQNSRQDREAIFQSRRGLFKDVFEFIKKVLSGFDSKECNWLMSETLISFVPLLKEDNDDIEDILRNLHSQLNLHWEKEGPTIRMKTMQASFFKLSHDSLMKKMGTSIAEFKALRLRAYYEISKATNIVKDIPNFNPFVKIQLRFAEIETSLDCMDLKLFDEAPFSVAEIETLIQELESKDADCDYPAYYIIAARVAGYEGNRASMNQRLDKASEISKKYPWQDERMQVKIQWWRQKLEDEVKSEVA